MAKTPTGWEFWKLLGGIVFSILLVILFAFLATSRGVVHVTDPHAYWALFVACIGLVVKMVFGDLASGEFLFYKHGYDCCVMTLGAILTGVSLQINGTTDIFAKLADNWILEIVFPGPGAIGERHSVALFVSVAFSLLATLLTAYVSRLIKSEQIRLAALASLLNVCIGAGVFCGYVVMILAK